MLATVGRGIPLQDMADEAVAVAKRLATVQSGAIAATAYSH
jgi:hypothetical protein